MVPKKVSLRARVMGRVQAVGFRFFTECVAEEIGLHGYVMNCRDGSVEVMVEGEEEALEELLRRLEQGPPGAWVEKVEATWGSYTGEFTRFSVRFGG